MFWTPSLVDVHDLSDNDDEDERVDDNDDVDETADESYLTVFNEDDSPPVDYSAVEVDEETRLRRYEIEAKFGYKTSVSMPFWGRYYHTAIDCIHPELSEFAYSTSCDRLEVIWRMSTVDRRGLPKLITNTELLMVAYMCCIGYKKLPDRKQMVMYHDTSPYQIYFVFMSSTVFKDAMDFILLVNQVGNRESLYRMFLDKLDNSIMKLAPSHSQNKILREVKCFFPSRQSRFTWDGIVRGSDLLLLKKLVLSTELLLPYRVYTLQYLASVNVLLSLEAGRSVDELKGRVPRLAFNHLTVLAKDIASPLS